MTLPISFCLTVLVESLSLPLLLPLSPHGNCAVGEGHGVVAGGAAVEVRPAGGVLQVQTAAKLRLLAFVAHVHLEGGDWFRPWSQLRGHLQGIADN